MKVISFSSISMLFLLVLAQTSLAELPTTSTDTRRNAIGVQGLGLIMGNATVDYEHVFGSRHGLFLEGGMDFNGGHNMGVAYRIHSTKDKNRPAIQTSFWGPFIRFSKSSMEFEDSDTKKNYDIDMQMLNIGLVYGRNYSWGKCINFGWRLGYGLPVYTSYKWSPDNYKDANTVNNIISVVSGIEGGISIGFVF